MEETIELSTPVNVQMTDNSQQDAPEENDITSDTAAGEPANDDISAERVNDGEENSESKKDVEVAKEPGAELLAGKFKTQDDLINGYKEAEKFVTKAKEYESKIQELEKLINQKNESETQAKLEEAKNYGFDSIEAKEISDKVTLREFELYAKNLSNVEPEYFELAKNALTSYFETGNQASLKEAKKYFDDSFIEQVAIDKSAYRKSLEDELNSKLEQTKVLEFNSFCDKIEKDYADFLSDVINVEPDKINKPKTDTLRAMFNLGAIKSTDDMNTLVNLYDSIAKQAVDNYITTQKGNQIVESIKSKAQVPTGIGTSNDIITADKAPSYEEISRMSQAEYDRAVDKWGLEKILKAK